MASKVLWLDLETTGLSSITHGIVQLACLVEIDFEIVEELDLQMRPLSKHEISDEALAVYSKTEDQIKDYPHPADQYRVFESLLERFINKYEKFDKFILAGYNIAFDDEFLRQFFVDNARTRKERQVGGYYGSWFFWPKRDVQAYLVEHIAENGLRLPNYKLSTVCEYYQIPLDAHDAMSDIKATRILYRILRYSLNNAAIQKAV